MQILFREDAINSRAFIGDVGLVLTYELRGLNVNTRYWLNVRGYNAAGDGRMSPQIQFTTTSTSKRYYKTDDTIFNFIIFIYISNFIFIII